MKFEPRTIEVEKRNKVLADFYKAVTAIEEYDEAKLFFKDLLTAKETIMLARRLHIATMLIYEFSYQEIQTTLQVGFTTIANVQRWLTLGGKGYRTIIERLKQSEAVATKKKEVPASLFGADIKKRYAAYYWPEKLAKDIDNKMAKARKRKSIINGR